MMGYVYLLVLSAFGTLSLPSPAHALTMEYYTYNGFDAILGAFIKAALVMSDPQYKSLMYLMAGVGFVAATMQMTTGGQQGAYGRYSPLAKHLAGTMIYLSLFAPGVTGTIVLYDATLNRGPTSVTAPEGVVFIAGYSNLVQRAITEIFGTAGDPLGAEQSAAGVGPKLLLAASEVAGNARNPTGNPYMQMNIGAYIDRCFKTDMLAGNFDLNNFKMITTDFMSALEGGASPSWDTLVFYAGMNNGETTSCADAWANTIKPWLLAASSFNYMRDVACGTAGYSPGNANELARCSDLIAAWEGKASGVSTTATNYLRQVMLANLIASTIESGDTTAQANAGVSSQAWGLGQVYSEWAPVLINFVTMLAIMMIPLFVLLLPTPWVSQALEGIVAVFVWVMFWTIFDFILHQGAVEASNRLFEEIRKNGVAYASIMAMPTATAKAFTIWSLARSASGLLATFATGFFFKQVGHVAGMVVGQLSAPVTSSGSSAGASAYTPQGQAENLQRSSSTVAGLSGGASLGMRLFQESAQNQTLSPVRATSEASKHLGGLGTLTNLSGRSGAQQMVTTALTARDTDMKDAEMMAAAKVGDVKGVRDAYDGDPEKAKHWQREAMRQEKGALIGRVKGFGEGKEGQDKAEQTSFVKTQQAVGDAKGAADVAKANDMSVEQLSHRTAGAGYERGYEGVRATENKARAAGMTRSEYQQAEQSTGTYADKNGEHHIAVAGGGDGRPSDQNRESARKGLMQELASGLADRDGAAMKAAASVDDASDLVRGKGEGARDELLKRGFSEEETGQLFEARRLEKAGDKGKADELRAGVKAGRAKEIEASNAQNAAEKEFGKMEHFGGVTPEVEKSLKERGMSDEGVGKVKQRWRDYQNGGADAAPESPTVSYQEDKKGAKSWEGKETRTTGPVALANGAVKFGAAEVVQTYTPDGKSAGMTVKAHADSRQLEQLARLDEKVHGKDSGFAKGVRDIAKGLGKGETAQVEIGGRDADHISTMSVTAGSKSAYTNMGTSDKGRRVADTTTVETGTRHGGTFQAAFEGDKAAMGAHLNPLMTAVKSFKEKGGSFDAVKGEAWALATKLASDDPVSKTKAVDQSHATKDEHGEGFKTSSAVEAKGGVELPIVGGVSVKGAVGVEKTHSGSESNSMAQASKEQVDARAQEYYRRIMADVTGQEGMEKRNSAVDYGSLEKKLAGDITATAKADMGQAQGIASTPVPATETTVDNLTSEIPGAIKPAMAMTPEEREKNAQNLKDTIKDRAVGGGKK